MLLNMKNKLRTLLSSTLPLYVIVCLSFSIILTSCAGQDKNATFKSGGMTQTFAEGKDSIPKDLSELVYPGATPTGSVSAEDDAKEMSRYMILSSNDSMDQIGNWYQEKLKAQGWEIDSTQTMPKLISISGHLKDVEVNVTVADDGGKTTISLQQGRSVDAPADEETIENFTPNKVTPPTD